MLLCLSGLVSSACSVGLVAKPEPLSWWDSSLRPRRGFSEKEHISKAHGGALSEKGPIAKAQEGLSEKGPIPKAQEGIFREGTHP